MMVVKDRSKVMNDTISTRLKKICEHIGANNHVSVKEWNHDRDHVHVFMTTKPIRMIEIH
ncbi:transposase [Microbacteriaceae bacterium 4G12]